MNVCSHSSLTLPHSKVHHPERLINLWHCFDDDATRYGNHQIELSTCTFRQHYVQVHYEARKKAFTEGVLCSRIPSSGCSSHVESVKEVQEGTDETPGRPIHNILHQCWFIFGCKWDNVCTFSCSIWTGRRRPISHRDVIVDNWQGGCLVTQ